jgi:sugar O-acyltransferase (sialic acid O-acetyltransferase NeuD family)
VNVAEKIPLVLFGDSGFAEIAFEYFTAESNYEVKAFTVEKEYLDRTSLHGLPVIPFESLESRCSPQQHSLFVAATYTQRNALRKRIYLESRRRGYRPASYISPRAFVWKNCILGEHCFVFEGNVIQPFVQIGSNVILWSGNHLGHHSDLGDHCFVSSHVVISGNCRIGEGCFFGVNATISNDVRIGGYSHIAPSAQVLGDVPDGTTVVGAWTPRKASSGSGPGGLPVRGRE